MTKQATLTNDAARRLFLDRHALAEAPTGGRGNLGAFAIFTLDIARFSQINECAGSIVGDGSLTLKEYRTDVEEPRHRRNNGTNN